MANNTQSSWGILNSQKITNNTTVVDEKYLEHLLTYANNPSDLNAVVLALYKSISNNQTDANKLELPPDINTKISHNNVVIFRDAIVSEYSENGYCINQAYSALDSEAPGRRKYFMRYINNLYKTELGILLRDNPGVDKIEIIKNNADKILSAIIRILLVKIASDTRLLEFLSREVIELNIVTIVCHAFVDCKILENPNSQ